MSGIEIYIFMLVVGFGTAAVATMYKCALNNRLK